MASAPPPWVCSTPAILISGPAGLQISTCPKLSLPSRPLHQWFLHPLCLSLVDSITPQLSGIFSPFLPLHSTRSGAQHSLNHTMFLLLFVYWPIRSSGLEECFAQPYAPSTQTWCLIPKTAQKVIAKSMNAESSHPIVKQVVCKRSSKSSEIESVFPLPRWLVWGVSAVSTGPGGRQPSLFPPVMWSPVWEWGPESQQHKSTKKQ